MSQDETSGNVSPENAGGEDASNVTEERKYSESEIRQKYVSRTDVEQIVKDRLARDRKTREKAPDQPTGKSSGDADSDLRGSLSKIQSDYKKLTERFERTKQASLKNMIEKKLASEYHVVDPELISDRFMSKGLVQYDDDDNVIVDDAFGSLDDLIKMELDKRPYLVKSTAKGGAGTKGPGGIKSPSTPNVANMTSEEFEAYKSQKYGITTQKAGNSKWLTGQ